MPFENLKQAVDALSHFVGDLKKYAQEHVQDEDTSFDLTDMAEDVGGIRDELLEIASRE